jgi:hypothetical protein
VPQESWKTDLQQYGVDHRVGQVGWEGEAGFGIAAGEEKECGEQEGDQQQEG